MPKLDAELDGEEEKSPYLFMLRIKVLVAARQGVLGNAVLGELGEVAIVVHVAVPAQSPNNE